MWRLSLYFLCFGIFNVFLSFVACLLQRGEKGVKETVLCKDRWRFLMGEGNLIHEGLVRGYSLLSFLVGLELAKGKVNRGIAGAYKKTSWISNKTLIRAWENVEKKKKIEKMESHLRPVEASSWPVDLSSILESLFFDPSFMYLSIFFYHNKVRLNLLVKRFLEALTHDYNYVISFLGFSYVLDESYFAGNSMMILSMFFYGCKHSKHILGSIIIRYMNDRLTHHIC